MFVNNSHIKLWRSKLRLKSETTQDYYFAITDKFLKYSKGDLSTEKVINFLNDTSKNSINTVFYVLRFFYQAAGIPFELTIGDISGRSGVKRTKEVLSPEEIEALIKTVKLEYGLIEIGFIFLFTIYGCRRREAWQMNSEDINEDISTLTIYTLKGGDQRTHLVPDCGKEIIKDFRYALSKVKKKPAVNTLNFWFDELCSRAKITLRPRLGPHSIRRSLISELMMGDTNPTIIRSFCRWKPRQSDILLDYTILQPARIDRIILDDKVHPFLRFW